MVAGFATKVRSASDEAVAGSTPGLPGGVYRESYPDNWFDKRMLGTGKYVGLFDGDRMVTIAGIHVYSSRYKVAALGNVTTHPEYRNRGCGKNVTAILCDELSRTVDYIGLNVESTKLAAIRLYE